MNLINLAISLATIIFHLNNSNCYKIKRDQTWENQSYITCKIRPHFESFKCNNFLSVICIVSKMSSYMQISMRNSINQQSLDSAYRTGDMYHNTNKCINFCVDKICTCFPRPSHKLKTVMCTLL